MSHVRNVQLTKDDIVTILLAPKSLAVSAIESSGLPDCQLLPEDVSNFLDQRRISQAYASQPSSQPASYPSLLGVPRLSAKEETLRKNGVPGLYQPQSFTVAWYDYQQWLVNSLSERIAGTTLANDSPKDILLKTARDPERAALFNYASMAWNNQFYFDLISLTGERTPMSTAMEMSLVESFSSIETLKAQFLETAYSMFGPGFVWLVRRTQRSADGGMRKFHILTTYLAGSPLAGAHNRLQPSDLNNENIITARGFDNETLARSRVATAVGSFGPTSKTAQKSPTSYGGIDIMPVLCVNTWQHAWMLDWTIYGKWQFLNAWWDRINWSKAQLLADVKVDDSHRG